MSLLIKGVTLHALLTDVNTPHLLAELEAAVCSETEADNKIAAAMTKEFFVPIWGGTNVNYQGALVNGAGDEAYIMLIVPQDFTAITDLEIILCPVETGANMNFIITTYYASYNGGELWSAHTETEDPRDIGATVNLNNLAHSIADLVDIANLVAGDLLVVRVRYNAAVTDSNAYIKGLRLRYT